MDQYVSGDQLYCPFGGYKDSGLGRENGQDAIKEYLQVKSV